MTRRGVLLFQGDSITDAGRDRQDPASLGSGYVGMVAGRLLLDHAEEPLTVHNRGISGNRSKDLLARWDADCVDLKPDFLSLYIGVNNTWRRYDQNDPTPVEVFERELRALLDRSFNETPATPGASILMEPFLLDQPAGAKARWREDLDPKRDVVRRAAAEYKTLFLPLQELFTDALDRAPAAHWAADGVHPTPAGHALIADAWLEIMSPILYP